MSLNVNVTRVQLPEGKTGSGRIRLTLKQGQKVAVPSVIKNLLSDTANRVTLARDIIIGGHADTDDAGLAEGLFTVTNAIRSIKNNTKEVFRKTKRILHSHELRLQALEKKSGIKVPANGKKNQSSTSSTASKKLTFKSKQG